MDSSPHRSITRKPLLKVGVVALVWATTLSGVPSLQSTAPAPALAADTLTDRPNLLFIMTDDQPVASMRVMPRVKKAFDIRFGQAVVNSPVCCPSRASILTGRHAHTTGVRTNGGYPHFQEHWEAESLGPWLQAQGYRTGFAGKYMNRYRDDDPVPPGWDEFYARVAGNHSTFRLREAVTFGPDARNDVIRYPNQQVPSAYMTRVLGSLATDFLNRSADPAHNPQMKPWALFVWTTAPHSPFTVEAAHRHSSVPSWRRPPSFMERAMGDKPAEVRKSRRTKGSAARHRVARRGQMRMLMSVDDMVGRILDHIEGLGMTDRTWGLFTSDNGYLWGEHRLTGKHFAYEESIRVPFRVMDPNMGAFGLDAIVSNIDIAPTLLELAGGAAPPGIEGRSLVPLLNRQETGIRSALIIEASGSSGRYVGLRTKRWSYVRWRKSGRRELYNLRRDPYQLRNVAKARRAKVRALDRQLRSML